MTEAEKAQAIYAARREEQMERNHRDALVLAEKLLDRAAELGATTDEFEEAVRYIQAWTHEVMALQPPTMKFIRRKQRFLLQKGKEELENMPVHGAWPDETVEGGVNCDRVGEGEAAGEPDRA